VTFSTMANYVHISISMDMTVSRVMIKEKLSVVYIQLTFDTGNEYRDLGRGRTSWLNI